MRSIDERQREIEPFFAPTDDPFEKYEQLLRRPESYIGLTKDELSDELLVRGCQSKPWLEYNENDSFFSFRTESDTLIIRGALSLLADVLNGQPCTQFERTNLFFLIRQTLSPRSIRREENAFPLPSKTGNDSQKNVTCDGAGRLSKGTMRCNVKFFVTLQKKVHMNTIPYRLLKHLLDEDELFIDDDVLHRSFSRFSFASLEDQYGIDECYLASLDEAVRCAKENPDAVFLSPVAKNPHNLDLPRNIICLARTNSLEEAYRRCSSCVNPYLKWIGNAESKMLHGCTIQELFDISADYLNNWIALVDSSFSLLAYTTHIPIDDEICQELIRTGRHSKKTVALLKSGYAQALSTKEVHARLIFHHSSLRYPTVMREYVHRNENRAHAIMVENAEKESPLSLDVFELFTELINSFFLLHGFGPSGAMRPKDSFIQNLASESAIDLLAYVGTARELGISRNDCFLVGSVALENANHATICSCALFLEQTLLHCITTVREKEILLLCSGGYHELQKSLDESEERIQAYLLPRKGVLLLSAPCEGFVNLPLAFRQIRELSIMRSRRLINQGELTPDDTWNQSLLKFSSFFFAWFFQSDAMDYPFRRYCLNQRFACILFRKDPDSYQLVRTYLLNKCSASRAGKELFLNRTTMLYRIKNIERIYGVSFENTDTRLEFLLLDRFHKECVTAPSLL